MKYKIYYYTWGRRVPVPRFQLVRRRLGVQANRDLAIQVSYRWWWVDFIRFGRSIGRLNIQSIVLICAIWSSPYQLTWRRRFYSVFCILSSPSDWFLNYPSMQVMRHGLRRRLQIVCGAHHWRVAALQMPPVNGVHHRISIRSYLKTCSAANSTKRKQLLTIKLNSYRLYLLLLLTTTYYILLLFLYQNLRNAKLHLHIIYTSTLN